jgi:hypothetical protein
MEKSVKELRRIAVEKSVNTNHCIEKCELVNAILHAEEQHETIRIIGDSSDLVSSSDSPDMPADGQSLKGYSSDDYHEVGSSKRPHRKSKNPSRRKSNFALWQHVDILEVQQLPHDIDGLVAFRLAFNPKESLQSSKDGRHWAIWVTSNRKGFKGIRRSARCDGGYSCENSNCMFLAMHKKKNGLQFENDESVVSSCSSCGKHAKKIFCNAQKIWEFERKNVM